MTRLLLVVGIVLLPALAAAQQAETIEYYGTDAIGSIRIVWDASGNVTERQDFTPFGEPVLQQGTAIPKEGFVGNETDAETNQDYFHARMFEARTGRFTRTDPIEDGAGDPQRWNRYVYGSNNPLRFTDPSGLHVGSCSDNGDGTVSCGDDEDVHGSAPPNGGSGGGSDGCGTPASFGRRWQGCGDTGGQNGDTSSKGGGGGGSTTTTTPPTSTPPCDPSKDPNKCQQPPPKCDPKTGKNCGPSVVQAEINGFLRGARNTCAYLFATEAMQGFAGDNQETAQTLADAGAASKMSAALSYAASSTNYLGTQGLMYPFKSSVFRRLFNASEEYSGAAVLINADLSIALALKTEYDAAANGECSMSGR